MTYDQADYFHIPLLDGSFGVGQVLNWMQMARILSSMGFRYAVSMRAKR